MLEPTTVYTPSPARYDSMTYNHVGASGLKLPAVSLGFWHNFGDITPYDTMRQIVFTAFDNGVTHFDLANNYGPEPGSAEKNCGRLLHEYFHHHRDELIISTKAGYEMWLGPYGDLGSRKYLLASLDQSLERLGLDYVDIFYHHHMDSHTPLEETMGALATAVHSGKALYVGLSNYDGPTLEQATAILDELLAKWEEMGYTFGTLDELGARACAQGSPHVIALDAGHGGMDTGAAGPTDEVLMCEQTVDALYALLEADPNYSPVRCRENGQDAAIAGRAARAGQAGACLLLSVHGNLDSSSQSHGFECYPTPPGRAYYEEASRFAHCIAQGMGSAGHRLRGETGVRFVYYQGKSKIVDSSDTRVREENSFGILEKAPCPAVLAEQCFLSNSSDYEAWATPQGCQRAARVYYEAICRYFGTQPIAQA